MVGLNGSDLKTLVDGSAIGFTTSSSLSISNSLVEVTTKPTDGWVERIPGVKSAIIDFQGLIDADFSNVNTLYGNIRNGTKVTFRFGIPGTYQLNGDGFISNLSYTGGTDSTFVYGGSIEVTAQVATTITTELRNLQINGNDVTINGVALMVAVQV